MAPEHPVSVLGEDESWRLLASVALGRLVTTIGTRIEIFPVNFVVQRRTVLFRTAEGTKLISSVLSDRVLFEADDHNLMNGWSVIVRGAAELLETAEDVAARASAITAVDGHRETSLRADHADRDLGCPNSPATRQAGPAMWPPRTRSFRTWLSRPTTSRRRLHPVRHPGPVLPHGNCRETPADRGQDQHHDPVPRFLIGAQ
jgi:hypothetical protein